jgi:hypothetical protein
MNKLIYQQSDILLESIDTFVETSTINIPSVAGGIVIARISGTGLDSDTLGRNLYVTEMVCKFQKNDSAVLSLSSTSLIYEDINTLSFPPRPSFVNNSNNLRVRFTRNGYDFDSYWIVDLDILYITT